MPAERLKSFVQERSRRSQEADDDYEMAAERPLDALKTDATEILGEKSGMFKGAYRKQFEQLESAIPDAEANVDVKSRRERYLEYRNYATQNKMNRINDRIANSSGGFLAKQINRQRKQTVANLNYKMGVRAKSIGALEKSRKRAPEELQKKIDALVDKRVRAMQRKAERVVMKREKGIKPGQVIKKAEFLATLTPELKAKIIRESILQVRKENIRDGLLDPSYEVDDSLDTRKIGAHYERTI